MSIEFNDITDEEDVRITFLEQFLTKKRFLFQDEVYHAIDLTEDEINELLFHHIDLDTISTTENDDEDEEANLSEAISLLPPNGTDNDDGQTIKHLPPFKV